MFRNYVKIAFRNLTKNKVHSGINLMGLAIGLACTTIIALWIKRELSVNDFHEHKSELYRVLTNQQYGDDIFTFSATPGPLAEKLKTEFPEITHACRSTWNNPSLLTYSVQSYYEDGRYVDPDFLKMFTFPLLHGDPETALAAPSNILISKDLADKYFVGENPLGKVVQLDNDEEFTVTGVLANVPENSFMDFDFLIPFDKYFEQNGWLEGWGNNGVQTYYRTQPGIAEAEIAGKIKNVLVEQGVEHIELNTRAHADWYLRHDFEDGKYAGGGRITTVKMFGLIAIFILLIACINFMNLSTAKSANRAMEVGVRKVTGATRGILAGQFISESLVMAVLAGVIGLAMASMILPYFNTLFDLELSMQSAGKGFYIGITSIILLTGVLAGSYPAFFLSGFKPVKVLKGLVKTGGSAVKLRKSLVTVQFVISIFLIVSTMIVYKQIQFIKDKNLGYDKENLVYLPVNGTLWEKYDAVKTELLQLPEITSVTSTNGEVHSWANNTGNVEWPGKDPEQSILFQVIPVGADFVETIGATLKDGRDFSPDFLSDSTNYIINETAAELMGMENPVGSSMTLWDMPGQVVGLLEDFHVNSIRSDQDPVILISRQWKNYIYFRLNSSADVGNTLASVETIVKKHNPAYPFEYHFTDQAYEELHQTEQQIGELSKVFAFLAIFVSCLGLFGLAAFATEQRRKEIGIRKVLGASVANLTGMVSREFIILVLIAMVIASPLAYYFMEQWLSSFAYRIDLHWWVFALAGLLAVGVAFLTVSFQSVKAALANPVESLRSE